MAAASVKSLLKDARQCLQKKEYREALEVLKQALKEDKTCYEAYVFVGKAAFHLQEHQQSEAAYMRATGIDPNNLLAWQGLAELHTDTGAWPKVYEAYSTLAQLASSSADASMAARASGFTRKAGDAATQAGLLVEAQACWKQLLEELHPEEEEQQAARLELLCRLADAQLVHEEAALAAKLTELSHLTGGDMAEVSQLEGEWAHEALESGAAAATLREILSEAPPSPLYAKYYNAYLQLLRKSVHGAPVGSMDRHHRRCAVLSFALHTIRGISAGGVAGGCCITSPFETALAMLEVEGNVAGASAPASRASFTGAGNFTPRGGSIPPSPRPADLAPLSQPPASRQGSGSQLHLQLPSGVPLLPTNSALQSHVSHIHSHWSHSGAGALAHLERAASTMMGLEGVGQDLQLSGMEHVAKRLVHAFPWSPAAAVHLALYQRRRGAGISPSNGMPSSAAGTPRMSGPGGGPFSPRGGFKSFGAGLALLGSVTDLNADVPPPPRTHWMTGAARRRRQIKLLLGGLRRSVGVCPSAAGWLAASEMLLEEGAPEAALDAAKQGLHYVAHREQIGHEHLVQADLLLKLAVGRALAAMAGVSAGYTGFTFETARGVLSAPASAQHSLTRRSRDGGARESGGGASSGSSGGGAVPSAGAHECPAALRARVSRMGPKPVVLAEGADDEALAWLGGLLLRGRVGGGQAPFARLAGSVAAMDLTQQATRCLAQLSLVRGDVQHARQLYEGLVAAAALGRVDPLQVPHWAAAEYAALLAAQGECMAALRQLEAGLRGLAATTPDTAQAGGAHKEAATVHHALTARYQLLAGMVCYQLGGDYRSKRGGNAHQHLLAAAAEAEAAAACAPEPDHPWAVSARQDAADAFSLLGAWYHECGGDSLRAAKCYQRALSLDPSQEEAGEALVQLMLGGDSSPASPTTKAIPENGANSESSSTSAVIALCNTCIAASTPAGGVPAATWAVRVLCGVQLQQGQAAEAMASLQQALRGSPNEARLWELLGAAYQQLGRHSAALRSYTRALELQPGRLYCLVQSGMLQLQQGLLLEASRAFTRAVQLQPDHPAARLGAAESLLATAIRHVTAGAVSLAGSTLREAAAHAAACTHAHGRIHAAWKLLGDILLQHADIPVILPPGAPAQPAPTPSSPAAAIPQSPTKAPAAGLLSSALASAGAAGVGLKPKSPRAAPSRQVTQDGGYVAASITAAQQRLAALRQARKAYAAALHINPCQGQVWGDAAMAVHQCARLMCSLPAGAAQQGGVNGVGGGAAARTGLGLRESDGAPTSSSLFRVASRMVKGGIKLAPSNDSLWGLAGDLAASHAAVLPILPTTMVPAAAPAGPTGTSTGTTTWVGSNRDHERNHDAQVSEEQLCGIAEVCMVRALQLNPRRGPTWAALARLYAARGERALAQAAAERCRLVDPRLVAVWEAMAALTAGNCKVVGDVAYSDALDAWEHAVGLGGAPESWLGYATGALVAGQAASAQVFSTALKAAAQLPMLPAARNTLGLAFEARGRLNEAIQAYQAALALLQHASSSSSTASVAGALAGVRVLPLVAATDTTNQPNAGVRKEAVEAAVKLNLARALTRAGKCEEAMLLWQGLEAAGVLQGDVPGLLAFGHALMQAGQAAAAVQQLEAALKLAASRAEQASSSSAPAAGTLPAGSMTIAWRQLLGSCLACVHAYLRAGRAVDALALTKQYTWAVPADLQQQLGTLLVHLWLVLLTAAAAAPAGADGTANGSANGGDVGAASGTAAAAAGFEEVARECTAWAVQNQPQLDSQVLAHVHAIRSAMAAAAGEPRRALSHAAAALHTCPWEPAWRLRVAQATANLGPNRSEAILKLAPTPTHPTAALHTDAAFEAAHRHVPLSKTPVSGCAPVSPVPLIHLSQGSLTPAISGTTAKGPMEPCGHVLGTAAVLAVQPVSQLEATKVQELVQRLAQLVHASPCDVGAWYLLSVLSLQQAADSGQCALYRKTFIRCRVALSHAERAFAAAHAAAAAAGGSPAAPLPAGQPPITAVLAGVVLRLLVALSECLVHSRLQGGLARAKDVATDALRWSLQHSLPAATAHRQLARVAVASGDLPNADLAFSNAAGTSNPTDPLTLPALLDYAHTFLLHMPHGHGGHGHGHAHGHASAHGHQATAHVPRPLPDGLARALATIQEYAANNTPSEGGRAGLVAASQLLLLAHRSQGGDADWGAVRDALHSLNKDNKLPAGAQAAGLVMQSCVAAHLTYQSLPHHHQHHKQGEEAQAQAQAAAQQVLAQAGGATPHQLALEARWAASSALKLLPPRISLLPASAALASGPSVGAVGAAGESAVETSPGQEGGSGRKEARAGNTAPGVAAVQRTQPGRATRSMASACLSSAELLLGKKDRAIAALQQAVASCPGPEAVARLMTLVATHPPTGSAVEARRAAARAVHQDPTSSAARHVLARILAATAAAH